MHGPISVKSPNNTSKWQMGFNSAFRGLIELKFFDGFSKNTQISSFVKMRPVEAELFYADG